ncbi:Nif3-like dinuclear metal center hexameric protein [Methylotenera sp.]|uniref:Nif3-like dinuclear metal center hexameric protein n=1 Tax=Methylotenera sp. TaxID=2051956 RepID=UPI00273092AC|nr:Nif3-like dinuclear metal center hexameric protein [Methylotenera sp.]MDP2070183.1 Nif3-like dinuclear metal center hexameric protein [Methylotenera sp.]MDP3007353.1 Nif3-like dinuclear metal center hexameric protein [Methylotenera sp.]
MVKLNELVHYTQQLMQVESFKDYCPNGLQVQGKAEIHKIVTGVTASMALLEAAKQADADLILVHHGYFWRNEDARVVGIKRNRLAFLLKNDLNLMAYHLPLDAHPEFGNNIQLARILGITLTGFTGESNIIAYGTLTEPTSLSDFAAKIEAALQRSPLVIGDPLQIVRKVAWCTGAAQGYMDTAIELGVDVFISGEISEQTTHQSVESGVSYISAGHHVTERYGVQALGEHLAKKFNLVCEFIDINNPV